MTNDWRDVDFTHPESDTFPPELLEREQWMGHVEKKPFAPWGDSNHPDADADEDARWKWGIADNYADGEAVSIAEDDHRLDGRAYIQLPSDPFAYVDGDDVRCPETGEVHPEFLRVVETLGLSYSDVSQSGAGVHTIYKGKLPDGVKQAQWQIDDEPWGENEDLPSVEIYAGKRVCVMTGAHAPGSPVEIHEWDSEGLEELLEEHDQLSTPSESSSISELLSDDFDPSATERDESTTDIRDIASAIDRLDARRVADQTIVEKWNDKASTGDGKRAFWPTWGSLTDNGTANIVDSDIWQDTGDRGGYGGPEVMALIDMGELDDRNVEPSDADGAKWWKAVDHLRSLGFAIPEYNPPEDVDDPRDVNSKVAARVLDELLSRYEGLDENDEIELGYNDRRRIGKLLVPLNDEDYNELKARVADLLDTTGGGIDTHRRLMQHKLENGPIIVEDGATWQIKGIPARRYQILNFELDVKSFLEVDGESLRAEVDVIPQAGPKFRKQIEPKIFKKEQRFLDELLAEQFGLTFDPEEHPKPVLDKINEYIATRDAPRLKGTHHLGRHGNEFVTTGGSLTPDGWTEEPETVYLEREIGLERCLDLPTSRDEFDADDVAQIVRELPETRPYDRLLPVLGWFYATPFRPEIYDREGEFNILNVTGDTGSGKTTTLRYLWRCFGMAGEPFDASDTWFVLISTYGATNSIPVWHDEYKPSDMAKREVDRFHDALRKTATGSMAQRGNADKSTTEYEMQAPAVVSGEQQIQPPAERRRSIMVQFRKDTTDVGSRTREVFKKLIGSGRIEDDELVIPEDAPDPTDHALAYYQWATSLDADEIHERWLEAKKKAVVMQQSWDEEFDLDDMERQGLTTIVFGWNLYRDFAESVGVDADELPGEDALDAALFHVATSIGPGGSRKSHLDRFVELIDRAASAGYLEEETHYKFVHEGSAREEIRIHPDRTYDALSKYARDHDLENEDMLDASAYRDRFKQAEETEGSYVVNYNQYTHGLGAKATGVSTLKAADKLNFSRQTFGLEPLDEQELASGGSDGDPDGGRPTAEASGSAPQGAATDGGSAEFEHLKPQVLRHLRNEYTTGQIVSPSKLAGELSEDPDRVESCLTRLSNREGAVRPKTDDTNRFVVQ